MLIRQAYMIGFYMRIDMLNEILANDANTEWTHLGHVISKWTSVLSKATQDLVKLYPSMDVNNIYEYFPKVALEIHSRFDDETFVEKTYDVIDKNGRDTGRKTTIKKPTAYAKYFTFDVLMKTQVDAHKQIQTTTHILRRVRSEDEAKRLHKRIQLAAMKRHGIESEGVIRYKEIVVNGEPFQTYETVMPKTRAYYLSKYLSTAKEVFPKPRIRRFGTLYTKKDLKTYFDMDADETEDEQTSWVESFRGLEC